MHTHHVFSLSLIALATLAGCSSMPANNMALDRAHSDYRVAQNNPQAHTLAPTELQTAGDALKKADASQAKGDSTEEVNHWAYLATQRTAIAQETVKQKTAELAVSNAEAARANVRLAARTNEANAAQLQSQAAQRDAESAQRQSDQARLDAEAAQQQAALSQQQNLDTQARNSQLEMQLADMNAKQTERGMVITIGDVLFDTDKSALKPSGIRDVEKLAGFLKQYPTRKVLIEGYTDSTGTESYNQDLSSRRAGAVRSALAEMGIGNDRIATHAYGEAYPVAGNQSVSGRQLNRRVEIVLSGANGNTIKR